MKFQNLLVMKCNKHILIIVTLLLLPVTETLAQQNQPIPDSNASWIIEQVSPFPGIDFFHKFSLSPYIDDTVINSHLYTKIYFRFDIGETRYYGAFRNDTNGLSYYIPQYSQEEYLLRDFSRNTGDTIKNVAYELGPDLTWVLDFYVDSSEYVNSGPYTYKVMYLSTVIQDTIPDLDPFETLVWMEKIGSFGGGILNSHMGALSSKRLYCMQYNDTIYYDSYLWWFRTEDIVYDAGECPYPVGINETKDFNSQIQVTPNPFYKQITLSNLPKNEELKISIFNISGQIVFSKKIKTNQTIELIDVNPELPMGLYILKIQTKDQLLTTKKIVKQ